MDLIKVMLVWIRLLYHHPYH